VKNNDKHTIFMQSKIDKPITKTKDFYCKKGDKLELVKDYGEVLIVSNKGNKFSIRKEDTK